MIVLKIKSRFLFGANRYNLRPKLHTCNFLFKFYEKIIKIEFAILTIAMKDLELHLSNLNLPIKKSAICLKLLVQKKEIGKQIGSALYDQR